MEGLLYRKIFTGSKIGNLAIVIMIVLASIFGAFFIPSMNFRMMWLGALLAAGLHLLLFYFVHGK